MPKFKASYELPERTEEINMYLREIRFFLYAQELKTFTNEMKEVLHGNVMYKITDLISQLNPMSFSEMASTELLKILNNVTMPYFKFKRSHIAFYLRYQGFSIKEISDLLDTYPQVISQGIKRIVDTEAYLDFSPRHCDGVSYTQHRVMRQGIELFLRPLFGRVPILREDDEFTRSLYPW